MTGTAVTANTRHGAVLRLIRTPAGEPILFDDLRELGYVTGAAIARFLGCGEATVSRMKNGEQEPGVALVASVAMLLPRRELSRYFASPYFDLVPKQRQDVA